MTPYEELEARIGRWAAARAEVCAALVVGSRARTVEPADEWSDLDLVLFVSDARALAASGAWLEEVGEVWLASLQRTGGGDLEWIALFAGGLKVDWVLVPVSPGAATLAEMMSATLYQAVYRRGVRVLLDKSDLRPPLPEPEPAALTHPSPAEFEEALARAWLEALRMAKALQRGDLWQASRTNHGALRAHLLTLMEWHARAQHGPSHDTWHEGRFLERWADPRAVAALPATVAPYEAAGLWQALFATLALLHWLARESAARLGYTYPAQREAALLALLAQRFREAHGSGSL